jgi:hypothetical protein
MPDARSGSVLFVTATPAVDESKLATAQNYAIQHKLPYAVVYCLEEADPMHQLEIMQAYRPLETKLAPFNIPFMILIGAQDRVLPWMSGHVKPVRVFTADDQGQGELQAHPIKWPGRVMTIDELQEMIKTSDNYCLPS